MKLSLTKRFGWLHVTGGRLLHVAQDHAVPTATQSSLQPDEFKKRYGGEKWVFAKVGDLALEIVDVKKKRVIGYSYLSGPALQLNFYGPAQKRWFGDEAKLRFIQIPEPGEGDAREAWMEHVVKTFIAAKYSEDALAVFGYRVPDDDTVKHVQGTIIEIWSSYAPEEKTNERWTCQLYGLVQGPKATGLIHFQPKENAQAWAATPWQVGLLLAKCGVHL